jgi:diacylglycerol kinase
MSIALVWATEMLNTAIEKIMDHLSPQIHPTVKFVKDVAAGATLIAAIAAAIIGAVIFIPYILKTI